MERIANGALLLLVLALPFNGLVQLIPAGELSSEGFFYASLIYLPIALLHLVGKQWMRVGVAAQVLRSQALYIALIALSFLLCFPMIEANAYGDRSGLERYGLSALTYVYYLVLTCMVAIQAATMGSTRFITLATKGFRILGIFLLAVSAIEVLSWFDDRAKEFLTDFRALYSLIPERPSFRLSGVSLEPSFNAFALLACMPWAIVEARAKATFRSRAYVALLLAACVLSGARTAYIGLALMLTAGVLVTGKLRRLLPAGLDGVSLLLACFLIGIVLPPIALSMVTDASAVSNVTRSYLTSASIDAGLAAVQGQGFGQVGFFVVNHVSPMITYSWELLEFYEGARVGELPPLFSWYGRSFGEFGVIGYLLLAFGFSMMTKRAYAIGHQAKDAPSKMLFMLAALFQAQFFAVAFSIESIRVPQYWLAWLLVGMVVATAPAVQVRRNA